eukprot:6484365-Amphidinium_carterae.1
MKDDESRQKDAGQKLLRQKDAGQKLIMLFKAAAHHRLCVGMVRACLQSHHSCRHTPSTSGPRLRGLALPRSSNGPGSRADSRSPRAGDAVAVAVVDVVAVVVVVAVAVA